MFFFSLIMLFVCKNRTATVNSPLIKESGNQHCVQSPLSRTLRITRRQGATSFFNVRTIRVSISKHSSRQYLLQIYTFFCLASSKKLSNRIKYIQYCFQVSSEPCVGIFFEFIHSFASQSCFRIAFGPLCRALHQT